MVKGKDSVQTSFMSWRIPLQLGCLGEPFIVLVGIVVDGKPQSTASLRRLLHSVCGDLLFKRKMKERTIFCYSFFNLL